MSPSGNMREKMIKLGMEVRDKVTGFKGIAVAETTWLNGCVRWMLQPKMGKDGKIPESAQFDEPQLEVVGKGISEGPRDTGGPIPLPSLPRGPVRR
jgi:hypothetical protein